MTDNTAVDGNEPSLGDLVHCANCGAAMRHTGQFYYCPNASINSGRNCPTNPVGTHLLLHKVFSGLIQRFATDDVISYATKAIKATTEPRASALRQQMDSAETALADAKTQDLTAFQLATTRTKHYQDLAAEIGAMDQLATTRVRESMAAREELDQIAFITDEQGIRNDATNPATFLEGNAPDEAQEFLDLLVEKVLVDSMSVVIVYQVNMPTTSPFETVKEDRVELYPVYLP